VELFQLTPPLVCELDRLEHGREDNEQEDERENGTRCDHTTLKMVCTLCSKMSFKKYFFSFFLFFF